MFPAQLHHGGSRRPRERQQDRTTSYDRKLLDKLFAVLG